MLVKSLIALAVVLASALPASAITIHVAAGGSLGDALAAAKCGDVITLEPGVTYQSAGGFDLTAKGCDEEVERIFIRTRDVTVTEQNKCTGAGLAKVQSTGGGAQAIRIGDNADYWTIYALEITGIGADGYGIVRVGRGEATNAADLPHHTELIGNYIHKETFEHRGVAYNGGAWTARWNCITGIHADGEDSQAIGSWNATGPCVIDDNYLQGASENIIFGGNDPSIANLVTADCVITNNTLEKDPAWCPKVPGDAATGARYNLKNLFELKNARRFRVEGNRLRYSCVSAQDGWAVLLTTVNQNGGCTWCVVEDITFTRNVIRDVAGCFQISGREAIGTKLSGVMTKMVITNNLCVTNVATMGPNGVGVQFSNSPGEGFTFTNNTILNEGSAIIISDRRGTNQTPGVVWANNVMRHGTYGVVSDRGVGTPALAYYWAPGYVFDNNTLAGGVEAGYGLSYYPAPATKTTMPTKAQFEGGFLAYAWPYTVKADGIFAGMGATLPAGPTAPPPMPEPSPVPVPTPTPTPVPVPVPPVVEPPAVNKKCVDDPLKITMNRNNGWPTAAEGYQMRWSANRKARITFDPLVLPWRVTAVDEYGCTATLTR